MPYFANNHTIFVKKTSTSFSAKENKTRKIDCTSLEFQPIILITIGHHCEYNYIYQFGVVITAAKP